MKKFTIHIILTILLLLAGTSAFAIGMSLNRRDATPGLPPEQTLSFGSPFANLVHSLAGVNIIIDTAVAKNQLFNYRTTFECDNFTRERDNEFGSYSYSVNRLIWANTFGFGFYRSKLVRLWAGPQIALTYEFSNRNNRILGSFFDNKIGTVLGANFHTGENITISMEMGFRVGLAYAIKKSAANIPGGMVEPHATFKLIFRAWDMFVPSGV